MRDLRFTSDFSSLEYNRAAKRLAMSCVEDFAFEFSAAEKTFVMNLDPYGELESDTPCEAVHSFEVSRPRRQLVFSTVYEGAQARVTIDALDEVALFCCEFIAGITSQRTFDFNGTGDVYVFANTRDGALQNFRVTGHAHDRAFVSVVGDVPCLVGASPNAHEPVDKIELLDRAIRISGPSLERDVTVDLEEPIRTLVASVLHACRF
ncbi:protein of unknown function [Beijerinckiaceae bacterium RH AL1]|nr:hypothetical protein [Beijerinckiaceae bacterium]VVB46794.1 protein of unknown function [Beijerinckiaceae bacterium RH CH11]VVB46877.1 protein of unknown function [Beijerinckiaceae bacterium RH AL8]VVC55562.1 protein of unknown function [Beijerinckiaceae bacterium RH AL1]